MKVLKRYAIALLFSASLRAEAPAAKDVGLPESLFPELNAILKQAVSQSPTMLKRALDLEIAENSRIAARAAILPSVSSYGNLNRSKDTNKYIYTTSSNSTSFWTTTTPYALTISQPVFYWGARRNTVRAGEIEESIAKGQYRDGYRQLAQTLRTNYLQLIVQKLSVKRAAFYLEFAKNQRVLNEARLAKKEISDAQFYAVRLAADQAQITSERVQFEYEMAKASFARLSGIPVLSDDAIPDQIPVIPYAEEEFNRLLSGFLNQKEPPTSEAETARKRLEIQNLNYASAKTRLRPTVSFNTGVSQSVQHNLYGTIDTYEVTSVYAGIGVSWTIFDGFYNRSVVRNALAQRRQMEVDYKDLTERLAQQAQTQVKQLNFAARTMAFADRALTDGQGGLKDKQGDFTRGTVSEADVSQTRIAVYDAEIYAYNNRIDFLSRVGDFLGTVVKDPVADNLENK
jgi:outer membrane protein TolC